MRNDFTITLVWNRRGRVKADGAANIEICAYSAGKRRYYNTKIAVTADQWDGKRQQVKKACPNQIAKNKKLGDLKTTVEKYCYKMLENGTIDIDTVFDCFNTAANEDFLAFVEKLLATDKTLASRTLIVNRTPLTRLRQYRQTILFKDITFEFLESWRNYLLSEGLRNSSIVQYMRVLKKWVRNAMSKGLIKNNPFKDFSMSMPKIKRDFLTLAEFEQIEKCEVAPRLQRAKDIFCFAAYTGLRWSDVSRITPKNLQTVDGVTSITLTMHKTKEQIQVPISLLFDGKAIGILEKYANGAAAYFGNVVHVSLNYHIKEIAAAAGISKNVSIHTARHTFATVLLNKGIPIGTVQKLLGHSNLATTQIYAVLLDDTVNENLKSIKW